MAISGGGTGPDYSRILAALANSRIQQDNNALYQCVYQLIKGVQKFQELVLNTFAGTDFGDLIQNIINQIGNIELTGDVAGGPSPSPVGTTIQPNVVTYAKMQQVSAASRLLGRRSTSAGNVEEISLGSGLLMSGTVLDAAPSVSDDYVVMSDGANPPSPMDDGNGNFIYVSYTP